MIHRTRIKMCGTTNIEDAGIAVQLGVDALGFIFAGKSPRFITPEVAKDIINELPPFVFKVGVFVDEKLKDVEEIVHYLGLNCVQFHGSESPSYCEDFAFSNSSCTIIKAFRIGEQSSSSDFDRYNNNVIDGILLDTYVKGAKGGTGVTFDWSLLKIFNFRLPVILAGGLNPENIMEALETTTPLAVDVNSGVEHSPGMKNHIKLARFIENVAEFDSARRRG